MRRKNEFEYLSQAGQMRLETHPRKGAPLPARQQCHGSRDAAYREYNHMVEEVVELLREAGYKEHLPLWRWPGESRWCIGEWDESGECKVALVEITLEFDADDRPEGFLCRAGGREVRASPTRDGLVRALMELHPPTMHQS